jgi:hypothetical protein
VKEYPSILSGKDAPELQCLAFDKYDGSNLRFEWHRKRGWWQFGTRHRLFNEKDPEYGCAIGIFMKKYAEPLTKALVDNPAYRGRNEAIAYCEFFGPHSFAGWHTPERLKEIGIIIVNNEPMDLVLFDVNIHKMGIVGPQEFVKVFGHLHTPAVVYEGPLTPQFRDDVRSGKYPVKEGVVCKGGSGHDLWMRKIKTLAYLEELKKRFHDKWERYWE